MDKYIDKIYQFSKKFRKIHVLLIGLLIGLLLFGAYRFFTYDHPHTHYHANFAVYINGQKEEFDGAGYYEEVLSCNATENLTPRERTHMHQPENSVVHVHDEAVTWGQFFENLGYSVGTKHLSTGTKVYVKNDATNIRYFLNGKKVPSVASTEIGDKDRLLVIVDKMSDDDARKLAEEIVPSTAEKFDNSKDPSTCSSGENPSFSDRLKDVF